jgi:hypothetical protein
MAEKLAHARAHAEPLLRADPAIAFAYQFTPVGQRDFFVGSLGIYLELQQTIHRLSDRHIAQQKLHWWQENLLQFADTGVALHPLFALFEKPQQNVSLATADIVRASQIEFERPAAATFTQELAAQQAFAASFLAWTTALQSAQKLNVAELAQYGLLKRLMWSSVSGRVASFWLPLDMRAHWQVGAGDVGSPAWLNAVRDFAAQATQHGVGLTGALARASRVCLQHLQRVPQEYATPRPSPVKLLWAAWQGERAARRRQRS